MSAEPEVAEQPQTETVDDSPEAWAAAENPVEEAPAEQEAEPEAEGEQPHGEEPPAEVDPNDAPPDFWSAERKALWAKITDPDVRAAIRGHVDDANKAIGGKMEEAAKARKDAEEKATRFESERAQSVAWWQQNGPLLQQSLAGKWAHFTPEYKLKLAQENPAALQEEQVRYEADAAQWNQLVGRQQREAAEHQKLQEGRHQQERAAEHQKLAKRFPAEFGTPEVAQKTYDTLSKYLLDQGISPDRLKGIYEEPVVSTVWKAYKYDQLQAKAKEVTNPKPPAQPASMTPKRIQPGPARPAGNQPTESQRQANERLRSQGRHNLDEVADAFR